MLIFYDEKEFFKKYFYLPIHAVFVKMVDVSYPNNHFFYFLILGLDISDIFDCLGSKLCNSIHDIKPAVWSNSYKYIYGIKCVGRIVTKSMSKICKFWRLIVGDCDYAER